MTSLGGSNADPTILTTEQIRHEMLALKELIEARLEENDKAVSLLHEDLVRVPTQLDRAIMHLRELVEARFDVIEEHFESVADQFSSRDTAVTAALQAQKNISDQENKSLTISIEKSEASTTKQLDSLNGKIDTVTKGLEGQLGDLKERVVKNESFLIGRDITTQQGQQQGNWQISAAIAFVGVLLAAAAFAAAIIGR